MKHLLSLSAGLLVSASLASALTFPKWQAEGFNVATIEPGKELTQNQR